MAFSFIVFDQGTSRLPRLVISFLPRSRRPWQTLASILVCGGMDADPRP